MEDKKDEKDTVQANYCLSLLHTSGYKNQNYNNETSYRRYTYK